MYKVNINTNNYDSYKKISKKNWEHGTINDFMSAINGWNTVEEDLKSLKWRIQLFCGIHSFGEKGWKEWYERDINKVTYLDNYCKCERVEEMSPYGFKQGYFNINKVIKEIEIDGSAKIPFEYVYDLRQYNKHFDGCYMEIIRFNKELKVTKIVELIKKIMVEDDYVNINEHLCLEKTWSEETSNSVLIILDNDTNIYVRTNGEYKYISMDSAKDGDWKDYDIKDIYEYEDTIIKYLEDYIK
ncbi:TPA: hypothetical protein KPJ80_002918 [Clostridioides difficile]|uniref:hypothetical protein n=1 Tax=Clostridioides difficile TaxID=1496 RepID=UPI000D1ECC35|nr:hypothetical protein [Clostridioides difficile]HBG2116822.1 hypothetical protein [Clostridioides difficile]HBG2166822.1 hypothetical protein [Clostridioides difficile]HBG5739974.1 hypothetical protein [Clostridioides difficile]